MLSLVSRFAANIFWLGRYIERAENLARILDINETYARDSDGAPSWERVLSLYADEARFKAAQTDATPDDVLAFYITDKSNPSSIISCVASARENARSTRHLLSIEMWRQLNEFHAALSRLKRRDATPLRVSQISYEVISGCQHFEGVAEGTFFRGEPWCFYQLGKFIERADQTTRILDMGYDRLLSERESATAWVHWVVLLRSVSGYHAFRNQNPQASAPHDIALFFLYDRQFPRAVARCASQISMVLKELEVRHGQDSTATVEAARSALEDLLAIGPRTELQSVELHRFVDELQDQISTLSDSVANRYFPREVA